MLLRKTGILGGTFDPVHWGHILIAKGVKEFMKLDEVLFVPSGIPPHKKDREVADACDRVEMVRLAIEGMDCFSLSTIEIDRQGYSYTVDTLKELSNLYPDNSEFYFIIGADVVSELTTWRNYQEVFRLCNFVAVMRPGYDKSIFAGNVDKMGRLGAKIFPVEVDTVNVSSSEIRSMISEGKDVSGLLPAKVYDYIKKKGLYV